MYVDKYLWYEITPIHGSQSNMSRGTVG